METPLNQAKCRKKFSLISDKSKNYEIIISEEGTNLHIQCQEENNIIKNIYKETFTLETLRSNKFLYIIH